MPNLASRGVPGRPERQERPEGPLPGRRHERLNFGALPKDKVKDWDPGGKSQPRGETEGLPPPLRFNTNSWLNFPPETDETAIRRALSGICEHYTALKKQADYWQTQFTELEVKASDFEEEHQGLRGALEDAHKQLAAEKSQHTKDMAELREQFMEKKRSAVEYIGLERELIKELKTQLKDANTRLKDQSETLNLLLEENAAFLDAFPDFTPDRRSIKQPTPATPYQELLSISPHLAERLKALNQMEDQERREARIFPQ